MTDMSKAELNLDAIEARAEAATPGPWVVEDDQFGAPLVKVAPESTTLIERTVADVDFIGIPKADFNAAFIAAARTDVPRLVRELREARRRLAELGECRAPGACQCGDDEACRFVRERDEARRELDEAKRTVAAASRYMFGRDEAIARAERSETMPACRCCNNTGKVVVRVDDEGNAVSVDCDHQRCATHLRDLAALDAHDNQGGGK